jgi:hypothetical protein
MTLISRATNLQVFEPFHAKAVRGAARSPLFCEHTSR